MNSILELALLHASVDDATSRLVEVFEIHADELEDEIFIEFNEMHRAISTDIRNVRNVLNVLALNGFVWTQRHTNEIDALINDIMDNIADLTDFAIYS